MVVYSHAARNAEDAAELQLKMNAFGVEHISDCRRQGTIDVDSPEHKKRLEEMMSSSAVRKPIASM
eukprot:scaffold18816_cov32-Tisochrysis_lutea.AAC.1